MSSMGSGALAFRASPRLYRGKVLLLAAAIAVAAAVEAARSPAGEEAAHAARPAPPAAEPPSAPSPGPPAAAREAESAGPLLPVLPGRPLIPPMTTVLITGATGTLGSALLARPGAAGYWTILRGTQFHDLMDAWFHELARFPIAVAPRGWLGQPVDVADFADEVWRVAAEGAARPHYHPAWRP